MKRFITISTLARIVAAGLLFWAIARHNYDYFTILRWVSCAVTSYCGYLGYAQKAVGWVWVMGGIGILFNPLVPVTLSRQTWMPIDIATGVVLLISIWFVQESGRR